MLSKTTWMIRKEKFLKKIFGKSLDVKESWEKTPGKFDDLVEFLDWFDSTTSIEDTLKRSEADWKYRFKAMPYFKNLQKGAALEIGFGGGRLLLQSSKDFKKVYGVDIHQSFAMTKKFLESQGTHNYQLVHRNELDQLPGESIDLVYSFIVFQHFDSLEEVNYYLNQIRRLLKSDGVAHIYFGKYQGQGVKVTDSKEFSLRDCSLFIEPAKMRELVSDRFEVTDYQDTLVRDPIGQTGESAQSYVVLKKK